MTMSNDYALPTLQQDVQRLLGRCILRLQQYERLIKAMVVDHKLSGPMDALEQARSAQIKGTALKTLGILVGELLGLYFVAGEFDPNEETETNSVHCRLHVVVDATAGNAAEHMESMPMGIKQYLVRLQQIGSHQKRTPV